MVQKPVFFFDCDNCLYSEHLGILQMMRAKIEQYMATYLNIPAEETGSMRARYHAKYGLCLRGLMKDYKVDPIDFDTKVDASLPLDDIIAPDTKLQHILQQLPMRKWVFTNAYKPHAERCIKLLGVEQAFDGIVYTDYRVPNFACKPEPEAYKRAMALAEVDDPSLCYLVDDSAKNIDVAKSLGWTTVHVTDDAAASKHGDYQIRTIHELPSVLPELWHMN